MTTDIKLLRRIAAKLPQGHLRRNLESIVGALATPAFFSTTGGRVDRRQTHHDDAQKALAAMLPALHSALPDDADVQALETTDE